MKKLLLISILLMFLVGNAFADEFVHRSQGQKIYIPCQHSYAQAGPQQVHFITRINVRNYDGDARIEYIEYYGVDPDTGDLLEPVKLVENFELKPWFSWYWDTRDFWGGFPTQVYLTRATPFFIIKWVSTNGKKIAAPSFGGGLSILFDYDIKAITSMLVMILEE